MSEFEHSRFEIWSPAQHPLKHDLADFFYSHDSLPASVSNVESALNYIMAVLYPNAKPAVANPAALPLVGNTINDYRVVVDDGDGKSAGYRWEQREGDATASWYKIYDMDWGQETVLTAFYEATQNQYVVKKGANDKDSSGADLTGVEAGQHVYGGASANSHLTLHANSGDGTGAQTGYVQTSDNVRPTADGSLDLGTATERFKQIFLSTLAKVGTTSIGPASINDSSGSISFNSIDLTGIDTLTAVIGAFTTSLTVATTLSLGTGSISDSSGAISFGATNLSTSGTMSSGVTTVESDLVLSSGSITSVSGSISFGNEDLITTGAIQGGDTTVNSLTVDNIVVNTDTITAALNVDLTINTQGSGKLVVAGPMTTENVDTTGTMTVTGQFNADNLRLDGNTISSQNLNGNVTLSPDGSGKVEFSKDLVPSADDARDIGAAALRFQDIHLSGGVSDGTNSVPVSELVNLKAASFRDAAKTQPAQANDALVWNGSQWLADPLDDEVNHTTISGLTTGDAGHTQFAMLAGRAGGQTIQGGTAAGESLVLESTANASKGTVQTVQDLTPSVDGAASLGSTSKKFNNLYTSGQLVGARVENLGSDPSFSAGEAGRILLNTASHTAKLNDGVGIREIIDGTNNQTISGQKTLVNPAYSRSTTASTTFAALSVPGSMIEFTAATVTVHGITGAFDGRIIKLVNRSGAVATIKNQSATATAAERIRTSDGADISLNDGAVLELVYSSGESRWLVGSSASSSGGSGGINFIVYDTSWNSLNQKNSSCDTSVGDWASFADAASTTPADLTGGTATVSTLSRTTTAGEILNGTASWKIVKTGSSAQGEGVSVPFNVPPAYQGKNATISFPFKVISGSLVQGDIKVFVYDVTNSTLITPFNNDIVGSSGTVNATFPVTASAASPANQQYRLGIYFASTAATAVTLVFDDVTVGPVQVAYGPVVSGWEDAGLTAASITGFGTPTNITSRKRQVGESIEFDVRFTSGTPTATEARVALPGNLVSSSDYATLEVVGFGAHDSASVLVPLIEPSKSYVTFGKIVGGATAGLTKQNASSIVSAGNAVSFFARIRCTSLSGSLPLTSASTFRISSYLASGSRVTASAPTALGQYRSYLRNAGTRTWTETSGAPATAPTAADGIVLYRGNVYGTADTASNPTKYDIYVGKNKNVQFIYYKSAGRTGLIANPGVPNGTDDLGFSTAYDQGTGVATIFRMTEGGSNTHYTGMDENGVPYTSPIYCDVIVSEPAIPVQVGSVRGTLKFESLTGYGSSSTKVGVFGTPVVDTGSWYSYASSASLGTVVTILEDGVYEYAAGVRRASGAACEGGISLNASGAQLTTSIGSLPSANRLVTLINGSASSNAGTGSRYLPAGSTLRFHGDAGSDTGTIYSFLEIQQVSK